MSKQALAKRQTRKLLDTPCRCRVLPMRLASLILFFLLCSVRLSSADGLVLTSTKDASLVIFAVHIDRTPKQPWPGLGIYLGNGYVLTAAHVAGDLAETNPRVVVAGKNLPTRPVRQGTFDGDDLTLLRIDDSQLPQAIRSKHVQLCTREPSLGSTVVVVTPEGTAESHLVAPSILSGKILARYPTLIGDVASTGNSGSGVFDKDSHCLLGVMSRKISLQRAISHNGQIEYKTLDLVKYFVGFDLIRKAIPASVVF